MKQNVGSFEKINMIDNILANVTRRRRERAQFNKIKYEKRDIDTNRN
jgi:hypothetical protein